MHTSPAHTAGLAAKTKPRWLTIVYRLAPVFGLLLGAIVIYLALGVLKKFSWAELLAAMEAIPNWRIALALLISGINYMLLTAYELLAIQYLRLPISHRRAVFTSFVAFSFSNNVGPGALASGSIRYRFYSQSGLPAPDIARIIIFVWLTYTLGIITWSGAALAFSPLPLPPTLGIPLAWLRPLGWLLLCLSAVYAVLFVRHREPFMLWRWRIDPAPPRILALQYLLSAVEWSLTAGLLYFLLPPTLQVGYPAVLGIFIIAQTLGFAAQVPGGLGVFEAIMLVALEDRGASVPELLGSLLIFRAIYFLAPFLVAIIALGINEMSFRKRAR